MGKQPAYCRQIAGRARRRIAEGRPRFRPSADERNRLMAGFARACGQGDIDGLIALFADDITLYADGGGKVTAALNPCRSRR